VASEFADGIRQFIHKKMPVESDFLLEGIHVEHQSA